MLESTIVEEGVMESTIVEENVVVDRVDCELCASLLVENTSVEVCKIELDCVNCVVKILVGLSLSKNVVVDAFVGGKVVWPPVVVALVNVENHVLLTQSTAKNFSLISRSMPQQTSGLTHALRQVLATPPIAGLNCKHGSVTLGRNSSNRGGKASIKLLRKLICRNNGSDIISLGSVPESLLPRR